MAFCRSRRPRYLRLLLCRRSPVARKIQEFISYAREQNAIIYYDINFRKSHAHEAMRIMPAFIENLEYADIVRGSAEDFETLLNETDAENSTEIASHSTHPTLSTPTGQMV